MALFGAPKPAAMTDEKKKSDPMPDGLHAATATYVKHDVTKTGKIRFAVLWQNEDEQVSWQNIIAPDGSSPKHTRMFYQTMSKLGLERRFLDEADSADEVAEAIKGAKALVTVSAEEYNGNTYHKVMWVDAL